MLLERASNRVDVLGGELEVVSGQPVGGLPGTSHADDRAVDAGPGEHRYDELLLAAASLKRGWVPASLLLSRVKSGPPQTPLGAALSEYGRIVRTNFLLRYCADPQLRARITGQLNKGETLHALRRHIVIGSRAQLPADEDDHHRDALCLQLLVKRLSRSS